MFRLRLSLGHAVASLMLCVRHDMVRSAKRRERPFNLAKKHDEA